MGLFIETDFELTQKNESGAHFSLEQTNPHATIQALEELAAPIRSPLAYDVRYDLRRWEQLRTVYGDDRARSLLLNEVREDVSTHLNEVGGRDTRVKYFEYDYEVDVVGKLRESVGEGDLVERMFIGQEYDVVGNLWLNSIIPFLENAKIGQSAFTLSAKSSDSSSGHEGAYDFGYFFIKESESNVACFAVELDLRPFEQKEVLNEQMVRVGRNDFLYEYINHMILQFLKHVR
ncbi:hypothetical protein ACFL1M_04945, partial [Patescibacteria group bacterium]